LTLILRSEGISKRFSKRIAKKIAFYDAINVDYINAASLLQSGKKIRQEMLEDWAVTILNDVRLMVFHGILKRLFAKSDNPDDYMLLMQGLNDKGAEVIFAGHTHGGQVCLPGGRALVTNCDLPTKYARGLAKLELNGKSFWLNVCAGLGHSIYAPIRLFCRPEIRLLTLTAKN
jgi:hypothetical protein